MLFRIYLGIPQRDRPLGKNPSGVKQKLQRMGISGLRRIRNFTLRGKTDGLKRKSKSLRSSGGNP